MTMPKIYNFLEDLIASYESYGEEYPFTNIWFEALDVAKKHEYVSGQVKEDLKAFLEEYRTLKK